MCSRDRYSQCSSRSCCSSWARLLCPCCATTWIFSDSAESRAGAAVVVHRRSTASLRAAEAYPHGPVCSENHRDSAVAVGQVVDAPVVQVVPCPLSCRQVLMVQTLQKIVDVPQVQYLCGCGRRCDLAATSSRQFREVPQTCSLTRCSSSEEGRFCRILLHFLHSVRLDVSAHFSALDEEEFFVIEGSGWRGRRESDSQVFCHPN